MATDPREVLMSMLSGGGAPPGAPPGMDAGPLPGPQAPVGAGPAQPGPTGPNPLDALQTVIQDVHTLMQVMPDPGHTAIVAQCLKALTGVQKDLMQPAGQNSGPSSQGGY